MNKKTIIVIVSAAFLLIVFAFVFGRFSSKQDVQFAETNVSKQIRISDSLKNCIKMRDDSIIILKQHVDSLKVQICNNNLKVKNEIRAITMFTPAARRRWDDSVLRTNGLK